MSAPPVLSLDIVGCVKHARDHGEVLIKVCPGYGVHYKKLFMGVFFLWCGLGRKFVTSGMLLCTWRYVFGHSTTPYVARLLLVRTLYSSYVIQIVRY